MRSAPDTLNNYVYTSGMRINSDISKTILLVEDEAIIALGVKSSLRKYGFDVISVDTGEKAVDAVQATPGINLVLMDINLGKGMDGTDAAKLILKRHDVPLVFHSSHTEPEVVEKTEGITSYGYIVKNSGETVLIASIKMAFRLWESEARFRTAFDNAAAGMALASTEGRLFRVNDSICSMFGYTSNEILSPDFSALRHPDDTESGLDYARSMLLSGTDTSRFTKRYRHKDGHTVWADISAALLRDASGKPLHFIIHVQDITELKSAEAALAAGNDRLISIFKAIPAGIGVIQGTNRIILDVNEKLCGLIGYDREELVGKSARILYPTQEEFEFVGKEKYKQIGEMGTGVVETKWMRKDGSIIEISLASTPIHPSDLSRGVTFSAMDITDRKDAEKRCEAEMCRMSLMLGENYQGIKNN